MNNKLGIGLAVVIGCTAAGAWVLTRHGAIAPVVPVTRVATAQKQPEETPVRLQDVPGPVQEIPAVTEKPVVPEAPLSASPAPLPVREKQAAVVKRAEPATPQGQTAARNAQPPAQGQGGQGKVITDPLARAALSFVGMDSEAEQVWASAINDPTVPADERKDLIEDLNEDGFVDPDHVTPDELPLVMARIDMIEMMAPTAMDDVNLAAFGEAYKDLTEIAGKLGGQ